VEGLSILQRQFDALPLDDAVAASYGSWQPPWSSPVAKRGLAQWTS
jgi:hypothetical protein